MPDFLHLWVQYHLVPESVLVDTQSTVATLFEQIASSFGVANPHSLRLEFPHSRGTCPGWAGGFAAEMVGMTTTVGHLIRLVFGDNWTGTVNPAWADFIEVMDTTPLEGDNDMKEMVMGFGSLTMSDGRPYWV
ncbi:hypothetical protein HDU86_006293 [Geranomyces michiganensis]|nr:hypothetical protein HDU86_006293 [Geranomyces michiganensis]